MVTPTRIVSLYCNGSKDRHGDAGRPRRRLAEYEVAAAGYTQAHGLPKKQAQGLLPDFVATITTHLKQGDRIRMSGLGILEVKSRAARTGRNPATGETIQIKASKKVGFRPAKELKAAI